MTQTQLEALTNQDKKNFTPRIEKITGSRQVSNYVWTFLLMIGGVGFLLAGLSAYLKINLLPFGNAKELIFIPQGIVMMFYGTLSLLFCLWSILTLIWDIGSGSNTYDKSNKLITIIRKGFPGKNRSILLTYPLSNVKSVGLKINEGLNPSRVIYLCLKDNRKIPLTPIQELNPISILELQAADLADYLEVNLESL